MKKRFDFFNNLEFKLKHFITVTYPGHFACVRVRVSVCVCVCVCVSTSILICVYAFVFTHVTVCMHAYVPLHCEILKKVRKWRDGNEFTVKEKVRVVVTGQIPFTLLLIFQLPSGLVSERGRHEVVFLSRWSKIYFSPPWDTRFLSHRDLSCNSSYDDYTLTDHFHKIPLVCDRFSHPPQDFP